MICQSPRVTCPMPTAASTATRPKAARDAVVNPMRTTYLIIVLALILASCNLIPEKVSMDDSRIQPLIQAARAFDRTAFGFTPLPNSADVRWESRPTERYDAMLHIDGKTSRTIAFRKTATGFKWTGEQEIFQGPKKYTSPDGTFNESITLIYDLENISGYPINRLNIDYWGEDKRLENREDLTLNYIKPILKEWGY